MSSYAAWQEAIRKAEQLDRLVNEERTFYYMVAPSVKDDQVKWRSHFPTMLDPNLLELVYGETWDQDGIRLLQRHWQGGDSVTLFLEDVSKKLGEAYAKVKDPIEAQGNESPEHSLHSDPGHSNGGAGGESA